MITLEQLIKQIWDAVDILRGHVNPSDYTNYLLRLLLLKQLSDRFEEEAEIIKQKPDLALNSQRKHSFFIPEGSQWSYLQRLENNVGDKLNEAFAAIENANPKLQEIFTYIDWKRVSDSVLVELIQHFSSFNLQNSNLAAPNLLGYACEDLIERFVLNEGLSALSTTPRQVAKLMVRLVEPQEGMQICDPVCGTGGLLVECIHQIQEQKGNPLNVSFYGQARIRESWAITIINLLMHDIPDFDIRLGNILCEPELGEKNAGLMTFDRVITNPPFNMYNWAGDKIYELDRDKHNRFRYGTPPNSSGDYAFIQHIIATLKKTGKAAVLMSHGTLFRMGTEAQIRAGIIQDDLIEAVIGLPPNLFFGTSIPAVILVINKNKEKDHQGKILVIDASYDYEASKRQNYIKDEDIEHIISAYRNFQEKEGYAKVVSCKELIAHDYNLSIKLYVTSHTPKVDLEAEINKLRELKTERTKIEIQMNECLRALGIET